MTRFLFISLVLFFLFLNPVQAQELEPVRRLGDVVPGELSWSPSGDRLAVGTSDGVYVYRSYDFSQPPQRFEGGKDVRFLEGDLMISGENRWNVATGIKYTLPEAPLNKTPLGTYTYNSTYEGGILRVTFLNATENFTIDLGQDIMLAQVLISPRETYAVFAVSTMDEYENTIFTIQVWKLKERVQLMSLPVPAYNFVQILDFSSDETRLLITHGNEMECGMGGQRERIYLWDVEQMRILLEENVARQCDYGTSISPDGRWIVYQTSQRLIVWNGNEFVTVETVASSIWESQTPSFFFSADSSTLATIGDGVEFWRLNSDNGKVVYINNVPVEGQLSNLLLSDDGSRLLATRYNDTTVLWDTIKGEKITEIPMSTISHGSKFSPDNSKLTTHDFLSPDITVWDVKTGEILFTFPSGLQFNSDWSSAAYWQDGDVHIVNLTTSDETILKVIESYYGKLLSTNGKWVVFKIFNAVVIYDAVTGQQVLTIPVQDTNPGIIFNENNDITILLGDPYDQLEGMQISLWDMVSKTERIVLQIPDGVNIIFSSDETLLAVTAVQGNGSDFLFDTNTGELLLEWNSGYNPYLTPDGQAFLSTDYYSWDIVYWRVSDLMQEVQKNDSPILQDNPRELEQWFNTNRSTEGWFKFSPTGRCLILKCDETVMCAYDLDVLPAEGEIFGERQRDLSFPDSDNIVFAPDEQTVFVKQAGQNRWTVNERVLEGQGLPTFSDDGERFAFIETERVSVWDYADFLNGGTTPLASLPLPETPVSRLAFNDSLLVIQDATGVSVWEVGK